MQHEFLLLSIDCKVTTLLVKEISISNLIFHSNALLEYENVDSRFEFECEVKESCITKLFANKFFETHDLCHT